MNFHTSLNKTKKELPSFMIHNSELVCPKKIYEKDNYPNLPSDMVKICGINGQNVFIPLSKLKEV